MHAPRIAGNEAESPCNPVADDACFIPFRLGIEEVRVVIAFVRRKELRTVFIEQLETGLPVGVRVRPEGDGRIHAGQ